MPLASLTEYIFSKESIAYPMRKPYMRCGSPAVMSPDGFGFENLGSS
jgi:hypothetical protein